MYDSKDKIAKKRRKPKKKRKGEIKEEGMVRWRVWASRRNQW